MKTKLFALLAATVGMIFLPLASSAADSVKLESSLNVANMTNGDTKYVPSVNAKVDDVVKVQLYIHNTELPTSGKVANNVKAKIVIPTAPGKTQTLTSTASADNAAAVNGSAKVNLTLDNASLQYIPGSATWTHNVGDNTNVNYKTEKIGDEVVAAGANLGNEQPCYNFEQYVTVQVRVVASSLSVVKYVKVDGSTQGASQTNTANGGDTLLYAIVVKNMGNTTLKNVAVGDNLPPFLSYVKGSTKLVDSNTGTAGKVLVDGITTGGVNVDDLAPGVSETIYLKATITKDIACGAQKLQNVAVAKAQGVSPIQNVAVTTVNTVCKPVTPSTTPTPTTPVTPTTTNLPDTGAETGLAGMGGLSALAVAGRSYLRSKKSLVSALRNTK